MTTGKISPTLERQSTVVEPAFNPRAFADLRFERGRMILAFADGREITLPLSRYPTLQRAGPKRRNDWQVIGPAKGLHWPKLDLDLSLDGLIRGLAEAVPKPPKVR